MTTMTKSNECHLSLPTQSKCTPRVKKCTRCFMMIEGNSIHSEDYCDDGCVIVNHVTGNVVYKKGFVDTLLKRYDGCEISGINN